MKGPCSFCGNKNVQPKTVEYIYQRNGKMLILRNVPCWECEFCGEQYFGAKVLKKIDQEFDKIYKAKKKTPTIRVPREDFASV